RDFAVALQFQGAQWPTRSHGRCFESARRRFRLRRRRQAKQCHLWGRVVSRKAKPRCNRSEYVLLEFVRVKEKESPPEGCDETPGQSNTDHGRERLLWSLRRADDSRQQNLPEI